MNGNYLLIAKFQVTAGGQVENVRIQGDERLAPAVRKSVESYQCSPGKSGPVEVE